ncbi:hypothetical protein AB8B21_05950 [Tardiphaga sp. 866_E4_N2_1]|uniref:hypothetical protein n=1 Tax=unclassified Tardiphaga TaxID=2631404 RepID=UPI003F28D7CD
MSIRVGLILIATAIWSMILLATAKAFLSPDAVVFAALGIGAVGALIASHCAEYDFKRSQRNRL